MSLNFDNGKWSELLLTFSWPHQEVFLGWSLFQPTKENPNFYFRLGLGLVSIIYTWGDENWEFDDE